MAFNLTRAAGALASALHAKATTGTIRAQLINIPASLARSARRLTLHLPTGWPWEQAWRKMLTGAGPPPRADPSTRPTGPDRTSTVEEQPAPPATSTRPRPPETTPPPIPPSPTVTRWIRLRMPAQRSLGGPQWRKCGLSAATAVPRQSAPTMLSSEDALRAVLVQRCGWHRSAAVRMRL